VDWPWSSGPTPKPVAGDAPETSPGNSHFMIVTVFDSVIDLWAGEGKLDLILHTMGLYKCFTKCKKARGEKATEMTSAFFAS